MWPFVLYYVPYGARCARCAIGSGRVSLFPRPELFTVIVIRQLGNRIWPPFAYLVESSKLVDRALKEKERLYLC